jgi:hypothetical protein
MYMNQAHTQNWQQYEAPGGQGINISEISLR